MALADPHNPPGVHERTHSAQPRQLLGPVLLAIAGGFAALFSIEAILWVGSLVVPRRSSFSASGTVRVLCVGDSHTYGVYFPENCSYPRRLEQYLQLEMNGETVSVTMDGRPGRTSAVVLERLPERLAEIKPAVVLILAGINDRWNRAGGRRPWWQASRLLRAAQMWSRSRASTRPIEAGEIQPGPALSEGEYASSVVKSLQGIVRTCREGGAIPVLLTYAAPDEPFVVAHRAVRTVASELDVRCIDLRALFGKLLESTPYQDLLLPGDFHPTPLGYDHIARIVAENLIVLLRGLSVELSDLPAPEQSKARISVADASGVLELSGTPGLEFRVYLSLSEEPRVTSDRLLLPLGGDRLFLATKDLPELKGRLDAMGRATISLDLERLPEEVGTLRAAAVELCDDDLGNRSDQERWLRATNVVEIALITR